jgi:predicted membrane protein
LKVNTSAGHTTLELEKLSLTSLSVDSGVGSTDITLPSQANGLTATINGGVGSLNVTIPSGVEARIKVDSGLGNVTVDDRFSKTDEHTYQSSGYSEAKNKLNLSLDAGVGSVNISSR